jgi:hypothetical protein
MTHLLTCSVLLCIAGGVQRSPSIYSLQLLDLTDNKVFEVSFPVDKRVKLIELMNFGKNF